MTGHSCRLTGTNFRENGLLQVAINFRKTRSIMQSSNEKLNEINKTKWLINRTKQKQQESIQSYFGISCILEHIQVHTNCEKYKIKTKRILFYEYVCKI